MTMTAIGDLARMLAGRNQHAKLTTNLARASTELSSGFVQDKTRHLRGDTALLTGLERDLTRLEAFDQSIKEALIRTSSLQMRLGRVAEGSEKLIGVITRFSATPLARRDAEISSQARASLENAIQQLNASQMGKKLFSGIASDRSPLPDAETVLSSVRQFAQPGMDANTILQSIDTWLDSSDGFLTDVYRGSRSDRLPVTTAEGQAIHASARADDPALRATLAYSALAVVASETEFSMQSHDRKSLYDTITSRMIGAKDRVTAIQADLGLSEARLEQALSRQEAERFAIETMRSGLIGTDRFAAATELQSIQQNLETLYAATARSAQLSFAGFLR